MIDSNPFSSKRQKTCSYNSIKRNRVMRSQKKFTEVQSGRQCEQPHIQFKNQLKTLLESAPKDQKLLVKCIDQLREKLQHMKNSPKRMPHPQVQCLLNRNRSSGKQKHRYKTNNNESSRKIVSKSLNLPSKQSNIPSLKNLQQLRNQIKKQKQVQRRIPTQKQCQRYTQFSEQNSPSRITEQNKKKLRYSSDAKIRSNTQQMIKSSKYPGRLYHHFSPRKVKLDKERVSNPFIRRAISSEKSQERDNNLIQRPPPQQIVDNNEKIGDLSTIVKQKQTLNFLGQSCVCIRHELSPPPKIDPQSSKLLQFVDWRTNQLKNVLSGSKQKKRKTGLDKLSKIFPKGFFV